MVLRLSGLLLAVCLLNQAQNNPPAAAVNAEVTETSPLVCPAGAPIGPIDLLVRSPRAGDEPLPFRTINHLSEGDTVLYSPIIRGHDKRNGEISLVMVPEKHGAGTDPLIVTDPKPADKPQEWKVGQTISVLAYVYGPEGLSKKKVKGFLSQDDLLIAQLADYAEKTE